MSAPTSTYRLQIRRSLTLNDAADLLDYLATLGVGAVYLSPLLTSTAGSDHGYDVTDPTTIDPQRGGEQGWRRLLGAARRAGLQVVIDIVPNHLGIEQPEQNRSWWDVLSRGRESTYADWFDIDWSAPKLLLPVLGDGPDELDRLRVEDGRLCYWEHHFPIAAGTEGGTPQQVHDRQHYQLVSFRRADTELGYRRFFAVNTLAGVRVEDQGVFDATHARIRTMIDDGADGIRVDHPDGLADPTGYLQRLRELAPQAWITVEKILEPGEELPEWPVAGSTGYDALNGFTGVFIEPAAEDAITEIYRRLTGDRLPIHDQLLAGKRLVTDTLFGSELRRLARLAPEVTDARELLAEAVVHFDVYRSYLPVGRERLIAALDLVRQQRPELAVAADRLQPRLSDPADELAVRFQQLTGAVMAKGVEDTAFYRCNRLIALNEVGGDPSTFGLTVEQFHAAQLDRLQQLPESMTALSTHDTKRSEDVRAWIAALAEHPLEWARFCTELFEAVPMPEPTIAYLLWQTVAAVGLIDRQRLHDYAEKAMREAAVGTGWTDPDPDFEAGVHQGIDSIYDSATLRSLVTELRQRTSAGACAVVLGQKLVQLTAPGVPDVYQGTEWTDDSLVDPDNRRPVDFGARRRLLAALDAAGPPAFDGTAETIDAVKLWVTSRALRARREFGERLDSYRPVTTDPSSADHLIGFCRGPLITLATRLPARLSSRGGWGSSEITLPAGDWVDCLTGRSYFSTVRLESVLADYPVALLSRSGARAD